MIAIPNQEIADALGKHSFFEGMPPDSIKILSRLAVLRQHAAQTYVLHAEELPVEFHLIVRGSVLLETPYLPGRGIVLVDRLEAGDLVGCTWFFGSSGWQYTARTISEVATVCFNAAALRVAIGQDPALGYELAMRFGRIMLNRLNRSREKLQSVSEPRP